MRTRSLTIVTALTLASMPAMVSAQAPSSPTTPQPPSATQGGDQSGSQRCAPTSPEKSAPPPGTTTGQADSAPLSDRLAAGNGVLCPPAGIDPAIRAPTPDVGKTPVIPPPGSPGGDPSVQPK